MTLISTFFQVLDALGASKKIASVEITGSIQVPATLLTDKNGGFIEASNPLPVTTENRVLSYASGTKAGAGDNTLVAAPGAANRLVVKTLIIQNETATATTMIVKDNATARWRCLAQNQGDGLALNFPDGRKLAENAALVLNLSGANQCGYSVEYYTEAV